MSPKGSGQKSYKGRSKLGSCGHELATYFWNSFSKFRHYNYWTKHVVLIMRITNMDDSSREELKEINFQAIKKHVLGSLQKTNLAHVSRKYWTFSIWKDHFSFVNKI